MFKHRYFYLTAASCSTGSITGASIHFRNKNSNFTIPHKKLAFRNFVLYPLKEISPKWKHPKTGEIIVDIINRLSKSEKMSKLKVK